MYCSAVNIHTTPSNELVLLWLLCVSVVLIISPEVFTKYVAIITIKLVSLIATNASTDPIPFIICLITSTSTTLIFSPMITFISTILMVSMIISIYILIISLMIISMSTILAISMIISIYISVISLMIISTSTILNISMIMSISTILIINLMIVSTISNQIKIVWFGKHRRIFVSVR